jgi:hypothetical protein
MTTRRRLLVLGSSRPRSTSPLGLILLGAALATSQSFQQVVQWLKDHAESLLVPLYIAIVTVYLTYVAFREHLDPVLRVLFEKKAQGLESMSSRVAAPSTSELDPAFLRKADLDDPQPVDLTGVYKLISNDNFDGFLEVQGVPWALRRAANAARPVHRITHRGSHLTIKIEGIIESQTTYIINGPPVETNVRGRIFRDQVTYLENDRGIVVRKTAVTENYDVTVQRELSTDAQHIVMTSTAMFRDERVPVQCIQHFDRLE